MELTGMQWLLTAFSFVIGLVVAMVLDEFMRKRDVPSVPRGLMDALAFVGVSILVAGMLVSPFGEALGIRKPPAPTPTPYVPGPVVSNEGYVMSVVSDALTGSAIEGATVSVLLSRPTPGQTYLAVASGTTDANGSYFFRLPGLTTGTVYVLGKMDGYYSDVASTTIPGAQVYPSESLWAKLSLVKIGSFSGSIENQTPNIYLDGSTIVVDSSSTDEQRFTIIVRTPTANTALKDLKIDMMRLPGWTDSVESWSVSISDAGGLSTSVSGDLSTSATQSITGSGLLKYGKTLKISISITLKEGVESGTQLAYLSIDDLLGGKGYAGETGASPVSMYLVAASL